MTRPIHSVKHLKSTYKKFQLLTITCTVITLIAVLISAVTSIQLGNLGRKQQKASSNQITGIETSLNKKLTSASEKISVLKKQLKEINIVVEKLRAQNASLQKKLSSMTRPPAPDPAQNTGENPDFPDQESVFNSEPTGSSGTESGME